MKKLIIALFVSLFATLTVNAEENPADTVSLFTPCIDFNKSYQDVKTWMDERDLQPSQAVNNYYLEYNDRSCKAMVIYTFSIIDDKKLDNVSVTYPTSNAGAKAKDLIEKVQKYYNVTLTKDGNYYSGIFDKDSQKTQVVILVNQEEGLSSLTMSFHRSI